jgi:hypothetical protein
MSATPVVPAVEDPWSDEFTHVQRDEDRGTLLNDIEALAAEQFAEQQAADEAAAAEEAALVAAEQPVPVAVVPEPEVAGPKATNYPDGSSVTIEKTSRGWKAELDLGFPGATKEVFYGSTKDEMWQNLAVAKLNATKKIREQNRQIKLGVPPKQPVAIAAPVAPQPLTADQIVALKQKLEQNPDAGFAEWIQLRTGRSIETLVQQADAGFQAREENILSETATAFVVSHPDYHKSDENFRTMIAYVAKNKLGEILTAKNQDTILTALVRSGEWTANNLDEAYEDLRESGLLEVKPVAPTPVEPVAPVQVVAATPSAPAPAAPVPASPAVPPRVTRQPRAGFGIRPSETTSVPVPSSTEPPSAKQLDDLDDAAIAQLMAGVRQSHFGKR